VFFEDIDWNAAVRKLGGGEAAQADCK